VLTLTGWGALAGMFALVTLVLAVAVYGTRKFLGAGTGASGHKYTMVVKQELAQLGKQAAGGSPQGLRR
jgi:hypothetical protein